jgi:hypothetical protein
MTTATRDEIVWSWLDRLARRDVNFDSAMWVTDDTYINAAPVHVDHDYYQGHLLEIVERETGVVSYIAVAEFHGPLMVEGEFIRWDHDSVQYEPNCGTFFDRTEAADPVRTGSWAVSVIYGMMESYAEAKSKNTR